MYELQSENAFNIFRDKVKSYLEVSQTYSKEITTWSI